ncbi:MAG: hypothetical protein MUO64_17380 [Anaerolineales bacterium]|nr:hypothetical protein [Anaerolineales bacterium]
MTNSPITTGAHQTVAANACAVIICSPSVAAAAIRSRATASQGRRWHRAPGGAPAAGAHIIQECTGCQYGGAERFIQRGYKSRLYQLHQIVHRITPIP